LFSNVGDQLLAYAQHPKRTGIVEVLVVVVAANSNSYNFIGLVPNFARHEITAVIAIVRIPIRCLVIVAVDLLISAYACLHLASALIVLYQCHSHYTTVND